jgi:hypothetical protein
MAAGLQLRLGGGWEGALWLGKLVVKESFNALQSARNNNQFGELIVDGVGDGNGAVASKGRFALSFSTNLRIFCVNLINFIVLCKPLFFPAHNKLEAKSKTLRWR